MSDGNDSAFVLLQMGFQPLDAFRVQMVRRLVEKQNVGFAEQQAAQSHPPPLSTGQITYQCIRRRTLKGIHGPLQLRLDVPASAMVYLLGKRSLILYKVVHFFVRHRLGKTHVHLFILFQQIHHLGYTLADRLHYGLGIIHDRFLFQIPYRISGRPHDFPLIRLFNTCYDLQQRGFTAAIKAYDTDLRPVKE